MTDETKKLFDAPWKVDKVDFKSDIFGVGSTILRIFDKTEGLITARVLDEKNANRLARLPELYDALKEAAEEYCESCIRDEHLMGNIPSNDIKIVENGCPFNNTPCKAFKWLDLLKKVRDGK